jgi:hypothetical protein
MHKIRSRKKGGYALKQTSRDSCGAQWVNGQQALGNGCFGRYDREIASAAAGASACLRTQSTLRTNVPS